MSEPTTAEALIQALGDPSDALARALMDGPDHHIRAWAASAIERLEAAGWVLVRKQSTGKAEPAPTWQGERD